MLFKRWAFYINDNIHITHINLTEHEISENRIKLRFDDPAWGGDSAIGLEGKDNNYTGTCETKEGNYKIQLQKVESSTSLILTGEWIMDGDGGIFYLEFVKKQG